MTGITVLVLLVAGKTVSPYFVVLAISAMVLQNVVIAVARWIPSVDDRRLDYELQMSLLDHQMLRSAYNVDLVKWLGEGEYKEPEYQSRIPALVATQSHSENTAKYN